VSTADQDPQLQLDALSAADCLKTYTETATGTKADRPQWNACLADLRRGDTLIIWKIDRLGRNLRDLVDIVTTLQTRGVGVRSLTNGIVDTTTAHGSFVFGMFALMAEYEAAPHQGTHPSRFDRRPRPRSHRRPQTQDDPITDQQSPTHVQRPPVHHGRDRPVLRRHPDDDLPPHPNRQSWCTPLLSRTQLGAHDFCPAGGQQCSAPADVSARFRCSRLLKTTPVPGSDNDEAVGQRGDTEVVARTFEVHLNELH